MKFKVGLTVFCLLIIFPGWVWAKKKIVRRQTSTIPLALRSDRQALEAVLGDVAKAKSVTYRLTYTADGISQGIDGTYEAASGSAQRELVFGTCSKGVCAYNQNITDMVLELRTLLLSGKTLVQKFSIKP